MTSPTIGFIGGGNMARALIGGLVADGWPQDRLWVADPDASQRQLLSREFGALHITGENALVVDHGDVLLFAVKPQMLNPVARALAVQVQTRKPLIVSIAAGVRAAALERWLGGGLAIVRCMPNTPALVKSAATGLYANAQADAAQRALAQRVLQAVGVAVWVEDELLLDVVTALSGSGPAYFLLVMEAMEQAAVQLGLRPEVARPLTLQTALGAARMALSSSEAPAALRARVTSKGGTTECAVAELERGDLHRHFERAVTAAYRRAQELAEEFAEG
ncbi:MAG: pyrroline-5-carboxylate reductase [Gammaproteobacteria bacterium]